MTKAEIVDTAFRVWGRNFYRKTSLSQLAGELRVSKTAIYRHFVNKEALTSAMTARFLDDFAASVRDDLEKAVKTPDAEEGIFIVIKSIAVFFAKNVYVLVFSLVNFYDRSLKDRTLSEQLKARGADMENFDAIVRKKYEAAPSLLRSMLATLTFYMSYFHKKNDSFENQPSAESVQKIVSSICDVTKNGLKFSAAKAGSLDFDGLEKQIDGMTPSIELEPLFRAVAEAVAEAGPWDASMDMVAKRMGISKSSLYGHFKDRKDMLRRLFLSEFKRIIEFAKKGFKLSNDTAEQLYLGIYSINVYLRSRPEILVSIGWIRTRKLDLGKPEKEIEIFRLFEDLEIEALMKADEEDKQLLSHWILFLLINTLTRPYLSDNENRVQNKDIRILYKFITMGLGGFIR